MNPKEFKLVKQVINKAYKEKRLETCTIRGEMVLLFRVNFPEVNEFCEVFENFVNQYVPHGEIKEFVIQLPNN